MILSQKCVKRIFLSLFSNQRDLRVEVLIFKTASFIFIDSAKKLNYTTAENGLLYTSTVLLYLV